MPTQPRPSTMKNPGLTQMRRIALAVLLTPLLCALVLPAAAETPSSPEATIQAISDRLADIWAREQERIKGDPAYVHQLANEIVLPHVDFQEVSRLAVGKHWRQASPAQQQEFSDQFQTLLIRTYASAFHELGSWSIQFLPQQATERDNDVLVRTEVHRPGAAPISVNYRMHLKDGHWQAYDVVIEGVSLVTNYRSTFAREVRQGGMDGLIKSVSRLNDRRSALKSAESAVAKADQGK